MFIFGIELVLKLFSLGFKGYLNDSMNILDASVVLMNAVELAVLFSF
jgi:hypothetical protein